MKDSNPRPSALTLLTGTRPLGVFSFPAGLYLDVDEEVVAFVRKANSPQLVLGTGEPPASE